MSTLNQSFINPADYGTWDPTGTLDCAPTLQLAINDACARRLQLQIPPGIYLLEETVHCTPARNQSQTLDMIGAGVMPGSANTFNNTGKQPFTTFICNFSNGPVFEQTGGIGCHYANFTVCGLNAISQYMFPTDIAANYVLTGVRDSPYSPHCGFSIDGLNTAVPSDGGWPNLTALYSASWSASSNALFENVSICNFVVGVALTLSGNGNLTDSMKFNRCNVTICKVCIATCQSQSKICTVAGGNWGSCNTVYDGVNYGTATPGQGIGWAPVFQDNTSFGFAYRLFNHNNQTGPLILTNCYAESIRSLGNCGYGGSTSRGFMTIQNMPITFYQGGAQGTPGSNPLPPIILESYASCNIKNVSFGINSGGVASSWNLVMDQSGSMTAPMVLEGCTFKSPSTAQLAPFIGMSATGSTARLRECYMSGTYPALPMSDDSTQSVAAFTWNGRATMDINSLVYGEGQGQIFYESPNTAGSITVAASSITVTTQALTFTGALASGALSATLTSNWTGITGQYPVTFSNGNVRTCTLQNGATTCTWGPAGQSSYGLTSAATTSATAGNVTLTFTSSAVTFIVGDVLLWQMLAQGGSQTKRTVPAWIVSNVAGTAITATPLYDASQYDIAANNPTTTVTILQNQWAPSGAQLTATTSSGSAALTSVTISSVKPLVGDWVSGTGIPANTRFTVVGTNTATLSNNATANGTAVPLYFGRFQTPTVTATW